MSLYDVERNETREPLGSRMLKATLGIERHKVSELSDF